MHSHLRTLVAALVAAIVLAAVPAVASATKTKFFANGSPIPAGTQIIANSQAAVANWTDDSSGASIYCGNSKWTGTIQTTNVASFATVQVNSFTMQLMASGGKCRGDTLGDFTINMQVPSYFYVWAGLDWFGRPGGNWYHVADMGATDTTYVQMLGTQMNCLYKGAVEPMFKGGLSSPGQILPSTFPGEDQHYDRVGGSSDLTCPSRLRFNALETHPWMLTTTSGQSVTIGN
jgi:hypothetical protein